jgi:ElaB/YqjD/DUF883 family membrane-anchored ribosome-binding protein
MNDTTTMHDSLSDTDQREAALRSEIDDSRARLGQTADAIGDKVLPGRIIERQKESAASSLRGLRDRVMGTAESAGHGISDTASSTVGQVKHAPDALAHRTEGSPLVAGAVAFGIGLLAAAVFKPTEPERQAVEKLADAAPDLRSKVEEAGEGLASSVKEHASEATEELKSTVAESASAVKGAATDNGH